MLTSIRTPRGEPLNPATPGGARWPTSRLRPASLAGGLLLVALAVGLSLALGARDVSLPTVVQALLHHDSGNNDQVIVWDLRMPRTVIGLLAGAALGLSGALMQGVTRNPIADPGLLGVNSGASLAVLLAITWLGVDTPTGYIWFAFAGAAAAAALVYGIGSLGWEGATPVKLALAGSALTAVATSLITLVLLTDPQALQRYRFWQVGSLAGRDLDAVPVLLPFLAAGAVLAALAARLLNALSLGDDVAHGLGHNVPRSRAYILVAIVLLCGSATALAGPIVFVGLVVPHAARLLVGADYGWILPLSALLGAALLLVADVLGRIVAPPGEVEAGLVVVFCGAPVLVVLVRRARLAVR